MTESFFCAPVIDGDPVVSMSLLLGDKPRQGYGFSLVSSPAAATVCLIAVHSSPEAIRALASSDDCLFIEDCIGESGAEQREKSLILRWLRERGIGINRLHAMRYLPTREIFLLASVCSQDRYAAIAG